MPKPAHPVCPDCGRRLWWDWEQDAYLCVTARGRPVYGPSLPSPDGSITACGCICGTLLTTFNHETGKEKHHAPNLAEVDWQADENAAWSAEVK